MNNFSLGMIAGAALYWAVVHRAPVALSAWRAADPTLPIERRAKIAAKAFIGIA